MSEDEDANMLAHLKKMGEKQVRLLLSNGGMPLPFHPVAFKWLTDIDQELERVREASKAEQIEIARSAKDAAWAAARAAERAARRKERSQTGHDQSYERLPKAMLPILAHRLSCAFVCAANYDLLPL
jgi:hypothetical protein